jgi:MSHA biogenesis protein MshQ
MRRLAIILMSLALQAGWLGSAGAAPKFARTTGNWSTNGNWSSVSCAAAGATTAPTAADDVTICNGITITVDPGAVRAALSVTIAGGANTGGLAFGGAGSQLDVTNDVTIDAPTSNGIIKQIVVGARTLNVGGNVTLNGGTTGGTNATRTTQLTVTSGTVTIGTVGTPRNLNITADASANAHASVAQVTLTPAAGVGTITVNGNVTLTGGGTTTHNALLTVAGTSNANTGIIITGDLNVLSPSIATTSSVTMTGAAGGRIEVGGNVDNRDTISVAAGIFSATGTGATFATGNSSAVAASHVSSTSVTSGSLTIAGNTSVTAGVVNPSGATLSVTTGSITIGTAGTPRNLSVTAGSQTNTNATASVTSGTLAVTGNTTITGRVGGTGGTASLVATLPPAGAGVGLDLDGDLTIVTTAAGGVGTGLVNLTGGGVINLAGTVNNGGTVTIATGTFNVTGASSAYNNNSAVVAATTTISSGSLNLTGATPSLSNAAGDTMSISTTGSIVVGNPATDTGIVSNAGTITLTAGGTFTANGDFTNSGTFTNTAAGQLNLNGAASAINGTFNRGTGTVTMAGAAAQALSGSALTFNNLTISNTAGAVTLNSNATITNPGILTMNGTATILSPAAAVVVSGTGTMTGTGTVQVTRTTGAADFNSQYTMTTRTLTNLTVEYIGTATQAINNLTYGSAGPSGGLRISNTSAAVTAAANFVVNGTLTMNGTATLLTPAAAVVVSGTGTMTGTGTVQVTRTAATAGFSQQYIMTTNTLTNLTVEYIGAAAQVVSALTYGGLKINNASGVSLAGNATAGGLLSLTSGVVTTGANTLISTADCPGSVTRVSGHVAGNLRLHVPGAGTLTCVFDIGDATGYRPVSVAFTTLSAAGDVTATVSLAAGDEPNIGTSAFDSALTVNRYWTLTNTTTAFTSASATFTWLAGDLDAGTDPLTFVVGRFSGGWTYPTTVPAALNAQATGLTGTTLSGSFTAGQFVLYSHWRMDQNVWTGAANEVVDSGSGANHGTASTCTFVGCAGAGSPPPVPTTSSVSPAVGTGGVSGTCSYGVFNRANKDYVALPGAYPKLMNAAGGFTITAWIYTTNNMLQGQRIMINDQNDTSPGSWGFSVGETTVPGGVRFYYRQPAILTLDTGAIPSNQWLFAAVSVSLAAGANASSATVTVLDTSGTTVASATTTFTWTAGADAGPPSIGGETNASTEGNPNFGFSGRIDEVRVYRGPLGTAQLNQIRRASRTCASVNHVRIEHDGIGLTCQPETMVVKACFDASCTQLFNGSVNTTLSPTGWVGGDAVVVTGSLSPQLRKTTPGVIALSAGSTSPAPTTGSRCFNGATETCSFEFKDTGFIFASVPNLTACKPSSTFTVQAVRTDLTTQNCAPAFTGARTVKFWSTYASPATGTNQVTLNSTTLATSSPGTDVALTFDGTATANLAMTYPDAGQLQLNASFAGAGSESGLSMTGSTTFVSAPFGVAVVPSGGACVAGDSSCAAYVKAGATFSHAVRGVCWTSDGDTDLTDNAVTPNFQLANIPLSANLVAPSGGANATLGASTVSISTGGTATVSQTVSEVGVFTITATPPAAGYFGLTVPGSTSVNIGRFTPNHFTYATNTPSFTTACAAGSFSYVGQAFNFGTAPVMTVTARNLAGGITTNYRGGFFKLTNSTLTGRAYTAAAGTLDTAGLPLSTVDPVIVDNSNGTASLTFSSGTGIAFNRSTPVAPFNADISLAINLIDGDGVVHESPVSTPANPARFGQATAGNGIAFTSGKDMRFGRLRIVNTAGSALAPLVVPLRTEYYTGTGFALNTADSCTTLARANISLSNYAKGLAACETMANKPPLADPIAFSGGLGTLRMSPPGAGNEGSVTLIPQLGASASGDYCAASPGSVSPATAATRSYLQGAWTGGAYDQNPSARAAFGTFGAQPNNFIFYRETY